MSAARLPFVCLLFIAGLCPPLFAIMARAQSVETTDYEYDALGRLIPVDRAAAGKTM